MNTHSPTSTGLSIGAHCSSMDTVQHRADDGSGPVTAGGKRQVFRAALLELARLDKSDLDAALRRIVAIDGQAMQVARVSYWELAPDHSAIHCRVLYQLGDGSVREGGELRAADFPAYFEAMLECRAIVAPEAWTDPRTCEFLEPYFKPNNIRSMLDVPVWKRGRLAGVVCHEHVGDDVRTWLTEEHDFALGIANMVAVALEAVDRRRAEESYALVGRATNDVLWDWDMVRNTVEWNDGITGVLGHPADEVGSDVQWWLDHLHPEDRARVKRSIFDMIDSRAGTWSEQYRWQRGDGTVATILDRGIVVRNGEGVAVRMVGSMVDVTERIQMQERLALSDRMASIGTLAAGVAHEINNPLTYIKANLTCAIEDLRSGASDLASVVELLREAQEGAERVRRIVRDLQTFSRPREDDIETLDVRSAIESAINMAWNEIRHRAQLVKDYGEVPNVRMNRARLGQVILNLLINAAQAIQEGAVDRNQILVRTSTSAAGEAVIEIRDTGCGIPAPAVARIFEPFFTTKAVGDGTGLGLAICHSIVTAAGGRIDVTSPPVGGCTVTVALPAGDVLVKTPGPIQPATARRRILLVDDEAPVRRALCRVLEPMHEVHVADSGEAAIEQLTKDVQFDVILCDLMMPHMSGMQLYDRLLTRSAQLARRVIFMTGGAFSKQSSQFLVGCERPVLEKPIDVEALERAVAELG
jgi:PAS domain S-box-containing protein